MEPGILAPIDLRLYRIPEVTRLLRLGLAGDFILDLSRVRRLDLAIRSTETDSLFETIGELPKVEALYLDLTALPYGEFVY